MPGALEAIDADAVDPEFLRAKGVANGDAFMDNVRLDTWQVGLQQLDDRSGCRQWVRQ